MSIDLDALKTFVTVAELQSFTAAAQRLGAPKARVSAQVQRLEEDLGTQLLLRSTRVVRITPEGELLRQRAVALLKDADDIGALFHADRALRGRVRLELPVMVAVDVVIPQLPSFFARHPHIQLEVCASDRIAAAAREGYDLVMRIGPVFEEGLVGKKLGMSSMINAASPAYLQQHGVPRTIDDLEHHLVVHYAADTVANFEYRLGDDYIQRPMRSLVSVDNFEAYEAAAVAGLGIVQVPRAGTPRYEGKLVEILPEYEARPVPVSVLHTHGR
ncbi:MAG TPA: LysR family transcriptional regulator, partial [Myxococcota bacterium]